MVKQAVLLLAHGTPETIQEIPAYLSNVTGGRPLPAHVIEEIARRYELIGKSPLTDITREQGKLVEDELSGVSVYIAMRNWHPYIADVVEKIRTDGVEDIVAICLAPQNSRTSVGLYRRAVEAAASGIRVDFIEGWADDPLLIEAFAQRLKPAWSKLSEEIGRPVPVLFTAHSVPSRTVQIDAEGVAADPYAEDALRTAALVASLVPEIGPYHFAFQSQGASGGPWIGPTVESTLDALAQQGVTAVILQPIGFLCDHVEILYDVDISFREYAAKLGIRLERPESLNGSAMLARAVAGLAREGLARLSGAR